MKTHRLFSLVVLGLLATACAPVIYEDPYASQPVYHDTHAYPVPVVVHVDHRQPHRARIEQELANRHRRAAAIYRGGGRPGELIEVNIRGGYFYHQGRRINYNPVSFRIAAGDIVRFPATGTSLELYVRYENGRLGMDTDIFGSFSYTRLDFNLATDDRRERTYRVHNDHIRDAQIIVRAVSPTGRHDNRPYMAKPKTNKAEHIQHGQQGAERQDQRRDSQVRNQDRNRFNVEAPRNVRSESRTRQVVGQELPAPEKMNDRHQNLASKQADRSAKAQRIEKEIGDERNQASRTRLTRYEQSKGDTKGNRNVARTEHSNSAKQTAEVEKKQSKQEKASAKKRQKDSDRKDEDIYQADNGQQEQKQNLRELLRSQIKEARAATRNR